jgi:preprotein translocase subunit SecD
MLRERKKRTAQKGSEGKMSKAKSIFTNFRVILVLVFILLAAIALSPNPFRSGAAIRSVSLDSPAYLAGIKSPSANIAPMSREVITQVNNRAIRNADDYYAAISGVIPGATVQIKTAASAFLRINRQSYVVIIPEVSSNSSNSSVPSKIDIGMRVYDAPTSNIRKGLDLQGGTRTMLKPEANATAENIAMTIDSMNQRLNAYGLSDVTVKQVSDFSGNKYILIEIAGAYEDEVRQLIAKQGKFEAKVGNNTIFRGGNDITSVCKTAECSGIDPSTGCAISSDTKWYCRFMFSITLHPDAAKKQAEATANLSIIPATTVNEAYLNETLDLYLDDQKVDSLNIGSELRGKAVTDVSISGSGSGTNREEAVTESLKNMKRLQTILVTGSLPIKLEIVKTDSISPTLGEKFLKNTALVFFVAILAVTLVLFAYYRKIKIAGMIMITGLIEVFITIGFLTLIGWNIDMAAIAGLIAAIGSNVDDQIVMTDEETQGSTNKKTLSWKQRIKNAFYIITGNYLTSIASVLPLLFAGAGLLKGFAITGIVGLTLGVLITRPAYAEVIEILLKDE